MALKRLPEPALVLAWKTKVSTACEYPASPSRQAAGLSSAFAKPDSVNLLHLPYRFGWCVVRSGRGERVTRMIGGVGIWLAPARSSIQARADGARLP